MRISLAKSSSGRVLSSVVLALVLVTAAEPSAPVHAQASTAEPPAPPAPAAPAPEPAAPAPEPAAPAPAPEPAAPAPAPVQSAPPPPPPPARSGDYGGRSQSNYDDEQDYDSRPEPNADDYGDPPEKHEFSFRIDPLNWLLEGRLGLELEVSVWKFISVQMVPIFVVNDTPPAINLAGFDDSLSQHSNGIGPIAGASLGAGIWLQGEPFSGYVLRFDFTNYGYTYEAHDAAGKFDSVSFTERRFSGFFGSHSRFGPFTIAGGFGLAYELNSQERCGLTDVTTSGGAMKIDGRHNDCSGEQRIAIQRNLSAEADLNGPLHPVYLELRFSLGFVF